MIHNGDVRSWTCLEPDPELAARLSQAISPGPQFQVIVGTLKSMKPGRDSMPWSTLTCWSTLKMTSRNSCTQRLCSARKAA